MGEVEGIVDLYVERLRSGGLPDVDHPAVIPLYGGGDADMSG